MASADGLIVPMTPHSASILGMRAPGSWAIVSPRRSWIWLAKMMTAMPAVKPTVTG